MEKVICSNCGRVIGSDEKCYEGQTEIYTYNKYGEKEYAGSRPSGYVCKSCYQKKSYNYDSNSNQRPRQNKPSDDSNILLSILLLPFKIIWWIIKTIFSLFWFVARIALVIITFGVLKNILFDK